MMRIRRKNLESIAAMAVALTMLIMGTAHAWITTISTGSMHQQRRSTTAPLRAAKKRAAKKKDTTTSNLNVPEDYETPFYPIPRAIDESLLGDLTGGRPGAIIETEEQLAVKEQILKEIDDGTRRYPDYMQNYGQLLQDEEAEYDIGDDPDAIDAATLGTWTIQDLKSKFDYEWDPNSGDPDPNLVELSQDDTLYLESTEKDEDGVEVGYDPIFGPSNPMDTRAIRGAVDSYMIDTKTRDDRMLSPLFPDPTDPEIAYNEEVVQFRKSLDIIDTYVDPFLTEDLPVPAHVAKWHGYPEQVWFEPKNFTNNRFTDNPTDFDALSPHRARVRAVELARAKNAEWLPPGVSQQWHRDQRAPYEKVGTLVGTLEPGECDPELVALIQPALNILGSCAVLLSIEGADEENKTVYRFAYHGLMKNKYGMQCWTETLLRDCGADVTGVVFETGFRRRDAAYDGGDPYYGAP